MQSLHIVADYCQCKCCDNPSRPAGDAIYVLSLVITIKLERLRVQAGVAAILEISHSKTRYWCFDSGLKLKCS